MKRNSFKWCVYTFLFLGIGMVSCADEDLMTYEDVPRIYFKYADASSSDFGENEDQITVNMGYDRPLKNDSIIKIPIKLMGRHDLRLKFALEQAGVGKCVPAGDGVGAEHGCVFFQCKQRIVERAAAADRITIRVFVAQNQDVIRSKQLFCHLLYIQLFCHPMFHPFRKADYSSVSSGWLVSSASPFTFSVRSSSLMWAA